MNINGNWWGNSTPNWDDLLVVPDRQAGPGIPTSYAVLDLSYKNSYDVIANLYLNGTTTKANIPLRDIELAYDFDVIKGQLINSTFTGSIFINNTAKLGGAIYTEASDSKIEYNAFINNSIYNSTEFYGSVSVNNNWWGNNTQDWTILLNTPKKFAVLNINVDNSYKLTANMYWNGTTNKANVPTRTIDLSVNGGSINPASGLFDNGTFTAIFSANKTGNYTVIAAVDNEVQNMTFAVIGRQFFATFLDSNGNALANTTVKFNINGVFYKRETDANGTARLNINLNPGNYTLTAINPENGEEKGFNVLVKSLIETNDLSKYYLNASKFEAKVYNKDGSLAVNKSVSFNINGVFYTRETDSNGVVRLAINLRPGNYTITTLYDGLSVGNNVCVLPTLETKDLSMIFQDGSKFQVKTLDNQGNPLANQNVAFNVNGVFYHKTTGGDGIASLNINLMKGEYIITYYWNNYGIGNKIIVA